MADTTRLITVRFLGEDTSLGRTAADVSTKVAGSAKGIEDSQKHMSGVSTAALLGVGAGLIDIGKKSIDASLEGEHSAAVLDTAVKNSGASLKSVGPALDELEAKGAKYGLTNDQVRQGLAPLITATGSVTQAEKDLGLTEDLAAAKKISLAAAAKVVGKVEDGNVGSLGRLGLATKDSTGKTLTQAAAMDELRTKFHGAADEIAKTPAGKLAGFHAQIDDLEEDAGDKLLPLLVRIGSDGAKGIDLLGHAWGAIPGPMRDVLGVGAALAVSAVAVSKGWGLAKNAIGDVRSVIGDVQTMWGRLSGSAAQTATDSEAASAESGAALEETATEGETAATQITAAFQTAADEIVASVGEMTAAITSLVPTSAEAAAGVDESLGTVDAALAETGVSAEEASAVSQAAFAETAAASDALAAQILADKEASSAGMYGGGGGVAPVEGAGGSGIGAGALGGLALGAGVLYGGSQAANYLSGKILNPQGAQTSANSDLSSARNNAALIKAFNEKQTANAKTQGSGFGILDGLKSVVGIQKPLAAGTNANQTFSGILDADPKKAQAIVDAISQEDASLSHHSATYKDDEAEVARWQGQIDKATGSTHQSSSALDANTTSLGKNSDAAKTYTDSLHAAQDPVLGAISATGAYTKSQQGVYYAQIALNQAIKQYGPNSAQAKQATSDLADANLGAVKSTVDLKSSQADLIGQFGAGADGLAAYRSSVEQMVGPMGITQGQADLMTLAFKNAQQQASEGVDLQAGVTDKASGPIATIAGLVDALNGKHASVTVGLDDATALANLHFLQQSIQATAQSNPVLNVTLRGGQTQAKGGVHQRAAGGPVARSQLYRVNELGHEMFEDRAGVQYFLPASDGKIIPNHALEEGSAMSGVPSQAATPIGRSGPVRTERELASAASMVAPASSAPPVQVTAPQPAVVAAGGSPSALTVGEPVPAGDLVPAAAAGVGGHGSLTINAPVTLQLDVHANSAAELVEQMRAAGPAIERELGELVKRSLISLGSKTWLNRVPG